MLLFDYRGYDASSGRPDETGLVRDTDAAVAWLVARGVDPLRIVMIGQSLGNAPAAAAAARRRLGGLILVSPFVGLPDAIGERVPVARWLPWPVNRFDVASHLRHTRAPILLVASRNDGLVPVGQADRVASAAPNRVTWLRDDRLRHDGMLAAVAADGRLSRAIRRMPVPRESMR